MKVNIAKIIAMHSSEASARRALAQFSTPPNGWLEIETVEGTERPEWCIIAYPTEGTLAFEKWVIANTPSEGTLAFEKWVIANTPSG